MLSLEFEKTLVILQVKERINLCLNAVIETSFLPYITFLQVIIPAEMTLY